MEKNRNLIIKIAFGVSIAALLFSIVTLIRAIAIHAAVVFPIIQVVGTAAIFIVCFFMLRVVRNDPADEEAEDDSEIPSDKGVEKSASDLSSDNSYDFVLTEDPDDKYNFSDFE